MTTRHPVTLKAALALLTLATALAVGPRGAAAQEAGEAPEGASPAPAAPFAPPSPGLPPPPPGMQPAPMPASPEAGPVLSTETDHDSVVERWGIETRRLASPLRSARGQICGTAPCPVDLNALGVRRWSSPRYAWGLGLAFALGGGGRRDGGTARTLDTYLGVGPTLSSAFLLANWKHLAVNVGPQLDVVYFMPSGSSPKSLLVNLRGLIEGEVHLGFIGLPALSVGLQTGLGARFLYVTEGAAPVDGQTSSDWAISTLGPTSLWDLVTQTFLRFYF